MHAIYTGERTRLRPIRDKQEALALQEQVYWQSNTYWGPGWWPREKAVKGFEENGGLGGAAGENTFVIERLDTGEAVGTEDCGLWGAGSINGWFGTHLAPQHRALGFGREAKLLMLCYLFENFPVNHVGSDTVADHWPARRGMEACGMTLEGRRVAALKRDGLFYDVVWYGILRRDWEQLPIRDVVKRGR
jgi:RimJ/RimL family protein N-acetyltransferase